MLSCTSGDTQVKDPCPKPDDIPKWVEWDCDKHEAYQDGRIYFNQDSSVFAYGSGDTLSQDEVDKVNDKIRNGDYEVR